MSVSLQQYAAKEKIRALCEEISMPATDSIIEAMENWDADWLKTAVEPIFPLLFSAETSEAATKAIEALPKERKSDGLEVLAVYLAAAIHSRELYAERGISNEIFIDTMKVFSRFVNEHLVSYDHYGYDRGYWTHRQLSLILFRIGTLEFEIRRLGTSSQWISGATPERWALSVHIPSDAILSRSEITASYRQAADFFKHYFPASINCPVYCSTWLLAPPLREMLKPGSGILNFQADYTLTQEFPEDLSCIKWIYKRSYENYDDLPETTSLARTVKAKLQSGGKIGAAFGVVEGFWR